jgi:hypothetical protein
LGAVFSYAEKFLGKVRFLLLLFFAQSKKMKKNPYLYLNNLLPIAIFGHLENLTDQKLGGEFL